MAFYQFGGVNVRFLAESKHPHVPGETKKWKHRINDKKKAYNIERLK